jgi:hypothetical protein
LRLGRLTGKHRAVQSRAPRPSCACRPYTRVWSQTVH